MSRKPSVLLTGASGEIGHALISRLSGLRHVSVRPTSSIVKYTSDTIEPEAED